LSDADAQHAVTRFMLDEGVEASERDVSFVWQETGGHPGLLEAVCHILTDLGGLQRPEDEHIARDRMDGDLTLRGECRKLWNGLTEKQQAALSDFERGQGVPRAQVRALRRIGILRDNQGSQDIFGAVFARYVRSLSLSQGSSVPGVCIDANAGEVWVDGRRTETLTDLEYRVLLLFFEHSGQLCNKYQIVKAVWGEDYIDRVDDARIEKLISRLRKKIEPDPNNPQYLVTVRGRGYKLVGAVGRRNE
jgi:DNA-binding winged helix-turn-helix (wHTH) protein